ncbi:hypothetical protein Y1Q_0013466 [Alligator mississippiensis]|uniref:Uncharacterized protein n=1 Tax=Alligator mississippiensis TaxID=8496 RepID=A0A151MSF3_ALLMI|nr:hypothetical protein Y1Q_0013466 [Alligator mississippiensis]
MGWRGLGPGAPANQGPPDALQVKYTGFFLSYQNLFCCLGKKPRVRMHKELLWISAEVSTFTWQGCCSNP